MTGNDAHGIVVHTGARVMGKAGAAEVLVTQTVKDLVAGATFEMAERGSFELKGVPGTWDLFDVASVDEEARPAPVASTDAAALRERATVPTAPRGPSRRGIIVAAVAALAIAAGLAFLFLRPATTYVPAAGTVTRIADGRFEEPVSVGAFPIAIAEGEGRVYVLDRESQVYSVDEEDGTTTSRGTDGTPTGAAGGSGAVWITHGFGTGQGGSGSVSRLDPASSELTTAFDTPIGSQAITYGAGAVWVANPNTGSVTRHDPVSQTTTEIAIPSQDATPRPDSIAFGELGGEALWVGDSLAEAVYRLDTSADAGARPQRFHGRGSTGRHRGGRRRRLGGKRAERRGVCARSLNRQRPHDRGRRRRRLQRSSRARGR